MANTPQTPAENNSFTVLRAGKAQSNQDEKRPPQEMLKSVEPGTIVKGPDGVQWVAMAAVPARWERTKKPIQTGASTA